MITRVGVDETGPSPDPRPVEVEPQESYQALGPSRNQFRGLVSWKSWNPPIVPYSSVGRDPVPGHDTQGREGTVIEVTSAGMSPRVGLLAILPSLQAILRESLSTPGA